MKHKFISVEQVIKDFPQYNADIIREWVGDGKVAKVFDNDSNTALLVLFENKQNRRPEYQYQRYFLIGDNTKVSVDKTIYLTDIETLVELYAETINENYIY